jgi:hypothetical protein
MTFQTGSMKSLSVPVVTLNCDITLRSDVLLTPAGTVLFRTLRYIDLSLESASYCNMLHIRALKEYIHLCNEPTNARW